MKKTTKKLDQSNMQHLMGYAIKRAAVTTKQVFNQTIAQPFQLTTVEFTILCLLLNNHFVTQKQLIQVLAISAPNLTTLLDRLVDRGLIIRERSSTDKRLQYVQLTLEGQDLANQVYEISLTMENNVIKNLSAAEKAILIELLNKISMPNLVR